MFKSKELISNDSWQTASNEMKSSGNDIACALELPMLYASFLKEVAAVRALIYYSKILLQLLKNDELWLLNAIRLIIWKMFY